MRDKLIPIEILLVEDNEGDVRLTMEALKEGKVNNNLHVMMDGDEATLFLKKEGKYSTVPTPDLILLDLNLPGKDGREILKDIKEDNILKRIPVVILTTSSAEEDILRAYDLHANCFISKPLNFESLVSVVKQIDDFWLTLVKLPQK